MTNAYRNVDGTDNNPLDPELGQAKGTLLRFVDPAYGDGISTLAGDDRPSAREISNEIFAQDTTKPNEFGYSDYLWAWGQFLDHDISITENSKHDDEDAPIAVPTGDSSFDPTSSGTATIGFTRSEFEPESGSDTDNPREQVNDITSYIDASNVYGADAERQAALREDDGRMKMSDGELMPFNTEGLPNAMSTTDTFFLGGDVRANENVVLSSIHILFIREHNRLVTEFEEAHPDWDGDTLYEEARRVVEAEIQAITYNEFLPKLLGEGALADYDGYKVDVNPEIANVFSTAAYRLGHTLLSSTIHRIDEDGSANSFGDLDLKNAFFRPDRLVTEGGIDAILRGAGTSEAESADAQIIDDVRNFLFGAPGSGGLDLASLNIQRGRDHGLEDYNTFREAYGLEKVTTFAEITADVELQTKLEDLFGTVDDIDVFVGGLVEDAVEGSMLGELFHTVLVDQFTRLRDGDAFWYESRLSDDEIAAIKGTTFSDIIERNSGVEISQDDVFYAMERKAGSQESDVMFAGDDPTMMMGWGGDDVLVASESFGEMHGGKGEDKLYGYTAHDWLVGGEGDDQLHGEYGDDYLHGGAGADFMTAGHDDDKLDGGDGNDYLVTGTGADKVMFSKGADVVEDFDLTWDVLDFSEYVGVSSKEDLTVKSFETGTLISDGDGNTLWLAQVSHGYGIVMDFGVSRHEYTGEDQSVVAGSAGDDTILNSEGTQYVFGHFGDDTFKVAGYRADYKIAETVDGTGYVMWSDTEVDLFWDLEHVEFVDETVDLDAIV